MLRSRNRRLSAHYPSSSFLNTFMPQANILVVDDEPDIRQLVAEILEDEGYQVRAAENGASARAAFARHTPDLVLLDIWMPDIDGITLLKEWSGRKGLPCPVVIMSGHGSVETAVEATRVGAFDFLQKPISLARLLAIVSLALASSRPAGESARRPSMLSIHEPIGSSPAMQRLRTSAAQAATRESPVLITGEPGSGRQSLARYIHERSNRPGPFVTVDHGGLERNAPRAYLLGTASGPIPQPGLLAQAAQGSLYLGDIQNLSAEARKIITQALEAGQFMAEDGGARQALTCRIMASGPEDLAELAHRDADLQRLYYHVKVLPLHVAPLRERTEDVPELVRFLADWFPDQEDLPYRPFSVSAQNRLRNHNWPGNVRELHNLVRRLLILGGEGEVSQAEVEEALRDNPFETASVPGGQHPLFDLPLREAREVFEREYLSHRLKQVGGSVGKLAESVGMERTHLYRKLRALGIDPKSVAGPGSDL